MFGSYNKFSSSSSTIDGDALVEAFPLISSSSNFENEYYGWNLYNLLHFLLSSLLWAYAHISTPLQFCKLHKTDLNLAGW